MIFEFILYLFVALQVAALIGGIVSRTWKLQPQQLVWHGTTVPGAAANVQSFLWDVDDFRFAYPTGQFIPDEQARDLNAGRVVMREANFKGSKGFGVIVLMFKAVGVWALGAARVNPFLGLIGGLLGLYFAAWLAAPFLIASIIDVLYRSLYRSEITAQVAAHPTIDNAVTIDLSFRGLSAFGIVGDVLRGIAEPAAPAGSAAHAKALTETTTGSARTRAANWAGAAERRSSVIYGTGVATSVVVALLLASFGGHIGGSGYDDTDSSYASESSYDSASDDASSDDTTSDADLSSDDGSDPFASDEDTSYDDTTESASFTSSSDGFSASPPDGWVQDSDAKDKGGFSETRWHLPGSPEVYGLVDHTAGYTGSAETGARGVRDAVAKSDGYSEIDFSAGDDDSWRWEFTLDGTRKLDVFHSCGAGGYAILAAAPEADWDTYADELTLFVDSFSCDSGSSDATVDAPSSDSSSSADGYSYPADTISGRMERAIRNHWQARLDGDYEKAFGYYTTPILNRVGSESNWASEIASDGLTDVTFSGFDSTETTPSRGRMDVSLQTTSDANGCQDWTFNYTMVHNGSRWLISDSTADSSSC